VEVAQGARYPVRHYDVNCLILFTDLPQHGRPAVLFAAGLEAIEYWWPFPESSRTDEPVESCIGSIRDSACG